MDSGYERCGFGKDQWLARRARALRCGCISNLAANGAPLPGGFVCDLVELVKARLTLLVLLTTAVGFYLGAEGPINYSALLHTVLGTALAAAGAAALNQWWEYKLDALMQRTQSRPVPAGRMRPT